MNVASQFVAIGGQCDWRSTTVGSSEHHQLFWRNFRRRAHLIDHVINHVLRKYSVVSLGDKI